MAWKPPDHPDYASPVLGPISRESRQEARSTLRNDPVRTAAEINRRREEAPWLEERYPSLEEGTAPPTYETAVALKGKFFPRGCRGHINQLQVYCQGAVADGLKLRYSPAPCMGPVNEVTFTPGAAWGWHGVVIDEFWHYDSIFIWVHECKAGVDYAYDGRAPPDGYTGVAALSPWTPELRRYYFRMLYTGETAGDVPVSGTLSTVEIPHSSSKFFVASKDVPSGIDWVELLNIKGAGYCEWLWIMVLAAANSHFTQIQIYCDGNLVINNFISDWSDMGFTPTSPSLSLLNYGVAARCDAFFSHRFEFKRQLLVQARNTLGNQTVSADAKPNLIS